jgi:hypothetical protein
MTVQKRLEALEAGPITEPTLLLMADGSIASISGRGDDLLRLFDAAVAGDSVNPVQAQQLDLIRHSTASREAGGAHLTDLIRCFLLGPVR